MEITENIYNFTDRCPRVRAAGVLTKIQGNTIERCLREPEKELVYFTEAENLKDACLGTDNQYRRVGSGNHGHRFDAGSEMRGVLKGNEMTPCQHLLNELNETVYSSHWNKPLGRRAYATPESVNPECMAHGTDTTPRMLAGDLINPPKSHAQVLRESEVGKTLYKISHEDYDPGEHIQRNYSRCSYNPCMSFGERTPCFADGRLVRRVLTWINSDPVSAVSVRQADFVDNYKAHLGKPRGLNRYYSPGRTATEDNKFGICLKSTTLEGSSQCTPKQEQFRYLHNINHLRYNLKKRVPSFSFDNLLENFRRLDENCCGQLPIEIVSEESKKHRIFINKPLVKLLAILDIIRDGNCVDYCKFVNLINWQCGFPTLPKANDSAGCLHYATVYSLSMTGEMRDTSGIQPAGVSSAQLDVPFPRSRNQVRVDQDNLEYETDVQTVLSPSLFTHYGLNHRDFFRPRTAEEIKKIFSGIGVVLPCNVFNELWKEGCDLDQTGGVCVETFRNLLHNLATENFINS